MVHNKRKKNSRQRGSWTHGWGEKKKHRGSGSRGGRGNAGSGKRGDQKKPSMFKAGRIFGKQGFIRQASVTHAVMNVSQFDKMHLVAHKGVSVDGAKITIDMTKMGYDKLLGAGKVTKAYHVTVQYASASAIEKIQQAGGSVTVTSA
ncbi:MAG: uL15m family ribosomal protein [Candidatus Woesearchaeota archaeon]